MLSLIEIESAVVVVSDELGNNIFIFYYHKQLAIGLDRLLYLALLAKYYMYFHCVFSFGSRFFGLWNFCIAPLTKNARAQRKGYLSFPIPSH